MTTEDDPRRRCWDAVDDDEALEAALGADEWRQRREHNFEEACVRYVLRHFGQQAAVSAIRREAADQTGEAQLTFPWFHEVYPTFPIVLAARDVARADQVGLRDLDKRFTKTPLYAAYVEAAEAEFDADEEPGTLAVVYRVGGTMTTLHNWLYAFDEEPGLRVVRTMARRSVFVIEPLHQLLDHVARGWSP